MSGSQTEDTILNSIPGLDDGGQDDGGQQEGASGAQHEETREGQQTESRGTQGADGSGEGSQGERQPPADPQRIVTRRDGLVERQGQDDPRRRDLVDPVTGEVVARGGIERRVYENAQRATRELAATKSELERLKAEPRVTSNDIGRQLNLTPEHQVTAMRVMSDFLRDPVATVEYMIRTVQERGLQLPSLQGQGQQFDAQAVARMLDERLAPIVNREREQQAQVEARTKAQRDLDDFLGDVPEAQANLDIIAQMLQSDPSLNTLPQAYIRLVRYASENGLDPNQPLRPQLAARQTQPGNQPRPQTRAPLPNGRPMGNGAPLVEDRRVFDENSRYEDIISASMREAGFMR